MKLAQRNVNKPQHNVNKLQHNRSKQQHNGNKPQHNEISTTQAAFTLAENIRSFAHIWHRSEFDARV